MMSAELDELTAAMHIARDGNKPLMDLRDVWTRPGGEVWPRMIGERDPQVGHLLRRARGRHVADPRLLLQFVIPSEPYGIQIREAVDSSGDLRPTPILGPVRRVDERGATHVFEHRDPRSVRLIRGSAEYTRQMLRNTRIGLPVNRDLTCVGRRKTDAADVPSIRTSNGRVHQAGECFSHGHHVRVQRLNLDEDVP